jgi:hypothetical protein
MAGSTGRKIFEPSSSVLEQIFQRIAAARRSICGHVAPATRLLEMSDGFG